MESKYSELTVDVERCIANAYDLNISPKKMAEIKGHLAYILPKLREPNALINPIKDALAFIHAQESRQKSWKDWLGKPVIVGLVVAGITAPVSLCVGISIEKYKNQDCQSVSTRGSTK